MSCCSDLMHLTGVVLLYVSYPCAGFTDGISLYYFFVSISVQGTEALSEAQIRLEMSDQGTIKTKTDLEEVRMCTR